MNQRFFKYLLIFSVAFAAKAKGESKISHLSAISRHIFGTTPRDVQENGRVPYFYFLGSYNNGQIFRSQNPRSANAFKNTGAGISNFKAYFSFLSYKFPQTSVGYVRSAKLILFPFHVFW